LYWTFVVDVLNIVSRTGWKVAEVFGVRSGCWESPIAAGRRRQESTMRLADRFVMFHPMLDLRQCCCDWRQRSMHSG